MPVTWYHKDTRGMGAALSAVVGRASSGDWSGANVASDVRDVIGWSYAEACSLSTRPPIEADYLLCSAPAQTDFSSDERMIYAALVMKTWNVAAIMMAKAAGRVMLPTQPVDETYYTVDDAPPTYPVQIVKPASGVLSPWLIGIGGFAVIALAGAWCYVSKNAKDVELSKGMNSVAMGTLMTTQINALAVLDQHRAAEKVAGHELPFNDGEKAVLGLLGDTQSKALGASSAAASPDSGGGGMFGSISGGWWLAIGIAAAVALQGRK